MGFPIINNNIYKEENNNNNKENMEKKGWREIQGWQRAKVDCGASEM